MKIKEIINKTLEEEMNLNPDVFILGEEVGKSGGPHGLTKNLMAKFGKHRVLDTPISEMGFTGLAVGASYLGLRPIIDYMTWNFALQSIDHIINSCAKTRYMSGGRITCPIVFRGPNGFNEGYAAQHTQDFSTFYGNIPGLKVVAPYTAKDHSGLLRAAIRDPDPVVILENEMLYDDEYESEYEEGYIQSLNRAVIEKGGQDLTIIGVSLSLREIFKAEIELSKIGISAEIINLVSIRPLDTNTIFKSVNKTGRLLIVDYSYPLYGLSSEISAQVYENCFLKKPIKRLNAKDVPTPYSKSLEDMVYPKKEDIIEAAKTLMN
ncbi:Pyruvate dehydrogenase E1 component subunit beta, mitochondrial [Nosema bombycis CQ1]|uniref:Pyruvate dehydrogenase E1 component subunit beta, mitochondrial n=2 Tax=Nosema bombycis TaxID=27978 RepID=R0M8G8_NOSB1|nr:mitochondrial pyruvate dehydrogenase E1 component subunit beta [Nosema bombycis]EOB14269.1 Pyruvate dehydrogenase E1 component subunit beta, mitochondrial [Nosema bombycis CQ1]|eukprot:EOB14269.1 Pyruvate dehydrogenase E1 component subunit beta, mitochondrial [Nosema bombycis CQ1]